MGPSEKGWARRNQNHPRHARDPMEQRKMKDDLMMLELLFAAVEDLAAIHGALDNQKTPDLGDPGDPGDLALVLTALVLAVIVSAVCFRGWGSVIIAQVFLLTPVVVLPLRNWIRRMIVSFPGFVGGPITQA